MDRQVVISIKTVIFTLLMLLGVYIVYRLGSIISILLIALVLVIAVEPLVKYFMSKTVMNKLLSRSFSVIITYILLVTVLVGIFAIGFTPVVTQSQRLILNLATLLEQIILGVSGFLEQTPIQYDAQSSLSNLASNLVPQLTQISGGIVAFTLAIFSNIITILSILILSIYMSLDWINIKERFISLFPENLSEAVADIIHEVEVSMGSWVKGQLLLMLVIGLSSFVGLVLLQVEYPLALGLIAGLLEIVPILGPVISAVLAAIIAFSDSPLKGLAVLGLFFIIQQLENNVLVPKIMQKVSGFSPLVILIALLIGTNFFGIVGAIFSVPLTMVTVTIVKKS